MAFAAPFMCAAPNPQFSRDPSSSAESPVVHDVISSSGATPPNAPSTDDVSSPSTRPVSTQDMSSPAPKYKRSKLLLTRRVYSWRLRGNVTQTKPSQQPNPSRHHLLIRDTRATEEGKVGSKKPRREPPADSMPTPILVKQQSHISSVPIPLPPLAPAQPTPFDPESYLDANNPLPGYFFARGAVPFPYRRRPGDPPARYLELRHGLVGPDSPHARNCANPRVTNRLRRWYSNAIRWRALHEDVRPVVPLTLSQRVNAPSTLPLPSQTTPPPSRSSWNLSKWSVATVAQTPRSSADTVTAPDALGRDSSYDSVASDSNDTSSATSPSVRTQVTLSSDPVSAASAAEPKPLSSPLLVSDGTRTARILARAPRVIVVGDVHGCIDELQSLLRLADFQPGDQVVLLGDLVAKGPDSVGVVQMARDVGARTVRGNHDHEVIRGCEALRKGQPSAMVSAEHAQIAEALGPEDYAWLIEAPWFIASPETHHLFVHAGFIPGVKLTQQNPRLMMNMRSVLEDGTVTAKNVPDCEWAKLWRGPQTVVFGHDAHRGLQLHEFAKGIDTGCVYGGRLTALLLPENRFISVGAKRSYIRDRGKFRSQSKN